MTDDDVVVEYEQLADQDDLFIDPRRKSTIYEFIKFKGLNRMIEEAEEKHEFGIVAVGNTEREENQYTVEIDVALALNEKDALLQRLEMEKANFTTYLIRLDGVNTRTSENMLEAMKEVGTEEFDQIENVEICNENLTFTVQSADAR